MGATYPYCEPGFYPTEGISPLTGIDGKYCAGCPLGKYCEGGDDYNNFTNCPDGWSGIAAGKATLEEACKPCPVGTKCRNGQPFP